MPPASAQDVARLAGVSGQTVSRVVSGSANVAPATRAAVESAMRKLDYRPHRGARMMRTGKSATIAVVTTSLRNTGNARALEAISRVAATRQRSVLVVTLGGPHDPSPRAPEDEAVDQLLTAGVDAVITLNEATARLHSQDALTSSGVAVVAIDPTRPDTDSVASDHRGGAAEATRHLLNGGHDTVWHLSGPTHSSAASQREAGWREALIDRGIEPPPVFRSDWTAAHAAEVMGPVLRETRPTAIFAANDHMALGIMRAARASSGTLPAIVGFDDIDEAPHLWPSLSTVAQDFDAIATAAVTLALEPAAAPSPPRSVLVPTRLIVRESSQPSDALADFAVLAQSPS